MKEKRVLDDFSVKDSFCFLVFGYNFYGKWGIVEIVLVFSFI